MFRALSLLVLLLALTGCSQPSKEAFLGWYSEHIAGVEQKPPPSRKPASAPALGNPMKTPAAIIEKRTRPTLLR